MPPVNILFSIDTVSRAGEELGILEYAERDGAGSGDPFAFGRYTYRAASFPERALFEAGASSSRRGKSDLVAPFCT